MKITKEAPERLQVWFWDESGFSLRVIRRKTWVRKGRRKNVTGQRRRGRVNIMGGSAQVVFGGEVVVGTLLDEAVRGLVAEGAGGGVLS